MFFLIILRYEYQKLFDKAVVIYINLSDPAVFEFLKKHGLYECAFENLLPLISLDREVCGVLFFLNFIKFVKRKKSLLNLK